MNKLEKNKEKYCQSGGITLVALVVTIIVLLILAGVAISLTIGNNGLFKRAENAANTWKSAEKNEQKEMTSFENFYDETVKNLGLNGGDNSEDNIKNVEDITGGETKSTEVIDKNGNIAVIPAGFTVDPNNNTVENGLVIIDKKAGNSDTEGNEFVWIPCTTDGANGSLKYDRYAFERGDWMFTQTMGTEDSTSKSNIITVKNVSGNFTEKKQEDEFLSISKYGGYYIGRYESGKEDEKLKIRNNKPVYNNITAKEAKDLAENLYKGKSKLCSSYAWDTALKFIGGTYSIKSEEDNYTGNLSNTGYHNEKNIFDLGGNVCEWTTEYCSYTEGHNVRRGGHYANSGEMLLFPAGHRVWGEENIKSEAIGFRVTLYL